MEPRPRRTRPATRPRRTPRTRCSSRRRRRTRSRPSARRARGDRGRDRVRLRQPDGDGDAALAVLRLVVMDALALDEARLRAVSPLAAAPESAEDLERGVRSARDAFVFGSRSETDETDDEPIDWSVVVASLLVKLASLGRHDARAAACLRRLARAAFVEWPPVAAVEDMLAQKLRNALRAAEAADAAEAAEAADESGQTADESGQTPTEDVADLKKENKTPDARATPSARPPHRRDWAGASRETAALSRDAFFSFSAMRETVKDMGYGRAAAVGAAAAFGGGLMFVSGGAAAPAVLASLASLSAAGRARRGGAERRHACGVLRGRHRDRLRAGRRRRGPDRLARGAAAGRSLAVRVPAAARHGRGHARLPVRARVFARPGGPVQELRQEGRRVLGGRGGAISGFFS